MNVALEKLSAEISSFMEQKLDDMLAGDGLLGAATTAQTERPASLTLDKLREAFDCLERTGFKNPFDDVRIVPEFVERPRSWRQRLFSWPWRPGRSYEWVPNPACPALGELWVMDPNAANQPTDPPRGDWKSPLRAPSFAICSERTYYAVRRRCGLPPL